MTTIYDTLKNKMTAAAVRRTIALLLVLAECFSLAAVGTPAAYAQGESYEIMEQSDTSAEVTPLEAALMGAQSAGEFADGAAQAADEAAQAALDAQQAENAVDAQYYAQTAKQAAERAQDFAVRAKDEADWSAGAASIAEEEAGNAYAFAMDIRAEAENAMQHAERTAETAERLELFARLLEQELGLEPEKEAPETSAEPAEDAAIGQKQDKTENKENKSEELNTDKPVDAAKETEKILESSEEVELLQEEIELIQEEIEAAVEGVNREEAVETFARACEEADRARDEAKLAQENADFLNEELARFEADAIRAAEDAQSAAQAAENAKMQAERAVAEAERAAEASAWAEDYAAARLEYEEAQKIEEEQPTAKEEQPAAEEEQPAAEEEKPAVEEEKPAAEEEKPAAEEEQPAAEEEQPAAEEEQPAAEEEQPAAEEEKPAAEEEQPAAEEEKPAAEEEKPAEEEEKPAEEEQIVSDEQITEDAIYDTYLNADGTISISGQAPADITVEMSNVTGQYADFDPDNALMQQLLSDDSVFESVPGTIHREVLAAYDITLQLYGEEYQPETGAPLEVRITDPAIREGMNLELWHIHNDGAPEQITGFTVEGNSIRFMAESFSVYVVCAYTVDFHWGDYTYSIAGESEITLSALLEKLGVEEITAADVAEVAFSDPALVEVEAIKDEAEQTTDWLLRSLAPFSTDEKLTLTLKNGRSVEIKVTDAVELPANGTWDNGTKGSGTWEVDENGVLTLSGSDEMKDYTRNNYWVKDTPWFEYIVKDSTHPDPPVTKIVITGGITRIGTNSFTRTYNLNEIDASNCSSLTTIGEAAFKQQSSGSASNNPTVTKTINFSGCVNLELIEKEAFRDCTGIEELDISETKLQASYITTFGNGKAGFGDSKGTLKILRANGCTTNFKELNLEGWNSLETVELSGCTNLTGLNLPSNITTLDLSGCTGLASLTVPSGVTTLNVSGCTGLTTLDASECAGLTTLNVSGCTNLTTLSAPSGVTTLDISGCTGLDSLDLSACTALTAVKVGDRSDLTSLSWLTLPASVTTLDASGFTSLTSLGTVPASVTSLNVSGCTGLTALDLSGTSLTDIDVSENASLTTLRLPATVTSLNVSDCPNLVLYFDGKADDLPAIPDSVSLISWGDYTYTIKKSSTATLDEIFTALGITAIGSTDVDSISVSDPSVLEITDLTVKSLQSFTEPQTLTVTLTNGMTGTISIACETLEEKDNLNLFLDSNTVYSYEGETDTHPLSESAILKAGDVLNLNLTLFFSEIPEGEEGERQMKLLSPMKYTFPEGLTVSDVPDTVTFSVKSGEQTLSFTASASFDEETRELTIIGNYGDQAAAVGASDTVSFTVPVSVQVNTVPGVYVLADSLTLSAVKSHNVKVSSFTAGDYNAETGTVTYTAVVEVENDLDFDEKEYFVEIADSATGAAGSYTYAHKDGFVLPEGKPATQVNGTDVEPGVGTAFTGFPLTVAHMYEGDSITLTYTAKPQHGSYNRETYTATAENTIAITSRDALGNTNPSNDPSDDTASAATEGVPCTLLTREYVTLDGSWAYWRVTVNPDGYTLNGRSPLTLADTFDDDYPTKETKTDAGQSIDYASVNVSAGRVTYDYSGSTGTFVIPDSTPVTITYRTRITAQPGEAKNFRGTAVLKTGADGEEIASATAGVIGDPVVIYPSASDVTGSGNYMVKLYVYGDKAMQKGIEGAMFILLDANQRALEYKIGPNKGQPVTFTTGSDGYADIELHEEAGDISIEKNTGYYLEMMQAVEGYQKDNTLYSFMITDDPAYSTGSFYQYYNGDTMKVRLYEPTKGLSVSIRFSGSYALNEEQQNAVTAVLQKLDENDQWVEVERRPYTDTKYGAITFKTKLYDETLEYQNFYRVVEENESPWDLPEYIHVETTYYSMVNTASSDPQKQPQEFTVSSAEDSVNVVIDNRYEDPQVTIVKMDKSTGEVLSGAVFTVYKIVNGEPTDEVVLDPPYTTDDNGEIVIRGRNEFQSETLYGIKETQAPELLDPDTHIPTVRYLLPLDAEWHYFYFCNDDYLEQEILANLPAGATATNLTGNGDRITIDNQREKITVPVMKLWQGNAWPENAEVVVGLYRSIEGVEGEEAVCYDDGTQRTVTLNSGIPYNNTAFKDLPSRDDQDRNYIYSIKEESINDQKPLDAGYNQEYGISSAGVYIVRNKPATALTVSKVWYQLNTETGEDEKVTDESVLAAQSPVTFDVYRSSTKFEDKTQDDGITNADMTAFVSTLTKVREKLNFGPSEDSTKNWKISIRDLDRKDDLGNPYYYYILETVPSFGNELYEVDEDAGTVLIKNRIAPETVNLTVTKVELVDDPRLESLDRDFEFTLKLQKDDTHPIRSWTVYTDAEHPENNLVTDWNGEAVFTLKPTDPDHQPTAGASITLSLPAGVTASVTETYNAEYTVATNATVGGDTGDDGRTFSYVTESGTASVSLTYTNTLHVVCKVVDDNGGQTPFESLHSALKYIRDDPDSFTAPWTIYMLEDYTIPVTDVVEIQDGKSLTLTTASTTDTLFPFKGGEEPDRAVITRGGVGGSMLSNAGTLNLQNIVLDGAKTDYTATGDGGLVYSSGTLNLNDKTTLRNSAASSKGGAVFVTGMMKTVGEEQTYVKGVINIGDGVEITGNSAPSASALYLNGTLNMTGGSITDNTGAPDGAVVVESTGDLVNLSGSPVIFGNTKAQNKAANLYIGADSDNIINVTGITADAHIGVSAMDGHMGIGEQFASAEFEKTDNLNRFVNDTYGYRGKLRDGTTTNIVWDGLTIKIKKTVDPLGANANDRFTITLSSMSVVSNTYIIDGTLDYSVSAARQNRPGRIILSNVKNGDEITISPLPVGDYTIAESASNYAPVYTIVETGSSEPVELADGKFDAENNSSITVTNKRRLADVKLTKTLDDRLKAADERQEFSFAVTLTEADGTKVSDFELADGITTDESGVASFTMSPMDGKDEDKFDVRSFIAPVGATMTITETNDPNYEITASALTMPKEGEGAAITDADTDNPNVFTFTVTDDGADVTFANVRKMAEIELRKNLTGKVSETESFTYTVTLTRADGHPAAGYVMYRDNTDTSKNITTGEDGKATIILSIDRDESTKAITLTIPEGTKLVVTETEIKKTVGSSAQVIYTTKYSVNGGTEQNGRTATINKVSDDDHSIVFNNTRTLKTITVTNTVKGYSGNDVPFIYTATVTDWIGEDTKPEGYDDYDLNGFRDGVMTFELPTGQSQILTVPYGATLTVTETFNVGYETTVKRGSKDLGTTRTTEFQVADNLTVAFTNNQLIGLKLVNNTSSTLENVQVYVGYGTKMYRVNDDGQDQVLVPQTSERWATLESIEAGKTAQLEIMHKTGVTDEQDYTVKGAAPVIGYYYTLKNEPSFHETADPAILRVYDAANYEVKGKLRYSVADSTVTFTEQPLVSFDSNGGAWTTEMDGYHDRDGDRKVYQKAVDSEDKKVAAPAPDPIYPTAENIPFLGWTMDEDFAKASHQAGEDISAEAYDFDTTVTAPITLYAVWAKPARDGRVVTVRNGNNESLNVTAALTQSDSAVTDYAVAEGLTTNAEGEASFTLAAGESKNLTVPDGAKLVLSLENASLAVSSEYTLSASAGNKSYTIDSVTRDGTVAFSPGVCKITDAAGNVLYDSNGKPAVYQTLNEALTKYKTALYTDASHTTEASQAAVKMLVDEYEIESAHTFPDYSAKIKDIILTTAGKDDPQYPYLGLKDRATLYRGSSFTGDSLFKITNLANVTFTDIILDGRNVSLGAFNGGLINVNKSNAALTIGTGTTLQNVDFAAYTTSTSGGAIYMKDGTVNVNAGLFSNLHAYQGGAICVTGGTLNVKGTAGSTQFVDCRSERQDGGAIYYNRAQDLLINGGTDRDNPGIIFTRCVAAYTTGTGDGGDGGAIFATSNYTNTVTVKGCSFIECSARTGNGSSTAGYGGGGICAYKMKGLTVEACKFDACDTLCGGGAVAAMVKYTETVENETVTIKNCSFNQCNCKGQAGALGVYQDNNGVTNSATKLSIIDSSFTGCSSGTNNGSGGAVQCYLPCMFFSGSTFSDCWAGKEGGAVNNFFGSNYTQEWSKSTMTVNNCRFIRCRAEDRYDPTALQHYGGGINTKVKTVTVTNSYFEDCVSTLKEGGALHIGGQGGGSTASITGSTFKNCTAKNGGGAVLSSHETLTIENSNFYGCGSSASNGGAVYHYQNSRGGSTQKNLTVKNSTFGLDPDDSESLGCIASGNGGAIWARATTSITLEGLMIDNCSAKNGGGIYLTDTAAAAKITGGAITDSTAESGSAVFVNKTATFSGDLSVSGNTVSTLNSGAIQTVDAGTLYFEGNVKVENNTCSADTENDHDVLMHINGNTIINTTSVGLGSGAHIGVYVSDPNNAYANHGLYSQPFGTYHNSNAGTNFLDAFFNNRDSLLYGYQGNDAYIHWGFYVCKITDADGNTLKRPNGRDAVYQQLSQAFEEFTIVKNDNGETGKAVYIKMLVEDYAIRQDTAITNFPAANITLTTASRSDTKHPYRGTEGTVSTIYRTNSDNPLFSMSTANAVFQLKDITLDGRKDKTSAEGDYKLIKATNGEVIVNSGTTLQYAKGDNGAAIDGVTVKINGSYEAEKKEPTVKIAKCTAAGSGGAINAQSLTITNADPNAEGKYGTSFMDCTASGNGGAVSVSGSTMSITGALFQNCQSTTGEGGAVCHSDTGATASSVIGNSSFTSCSAALSGGAVSSGAGTLTLTQSIFDNCRSKQNGGAVSHTGTAGTTITGSTFNGCLTNTDISTDPDHGFGGSVYSKAAVVSLNGGEFKNSTSANHGGALYCENSGADSTVTTVTVSGTSFENCSSNRGDGAGGAIYSKTKALTLQSYTPEGGTTVNTTINACMALGTSGAVHMETSGSTLTVKDSTVISNCYAGMGGAIYLPANVTMNLSDSPEFTNNGYRTIGGIIENATAGACIYLAEGSRINFSGSPKFSRNILPNLGWITNGGITDRVRQDVYLAGYASTTPFATNAASIYVVGELTGDTIWVWPEKSPHRLANEQFAKIADGITVSADTLSHFRNALADSETDCNYGEYLAGVQVGTDTENVYWDKMYVVEFKKKDNKGVAVPGAGFTLYKDLACTQPVATVKSADGENDTDAQGKLLARGMVEFTSIRIGAYYMKESTVPLSFKENNSTYLLLVGTPFLSPNDHNRYLWEGDGPLNVTDAATLVARHTTDAGKFYGLFPLDENNKAVLRANLVSNNEGIINIRNDYQVSFMKEDGAGKALPGAAFTIYTAILDSEGNPSTYPDGYPELMLWSRDGETYPAPVVSADGTSAYRDVNNKTLKKGIVYFRELPLGTYYLLETEYPDRNGSGRRTYYLESDRVFKLDLAEDPNEQGKAVITISELKLATETEPASYVELSKDKNGNYRVINQEVVCKLTDNNNNLLYIEGHKVRDNKESEASPRLFPAIYATLEAGFADAQNRSFVYANGSAANVDDVKAIKLKVLKDFNLTEPILYNSDRKITFTTAETSVSKDRYIFVTTRTTDTSRALIRRAYDADTSADANAGALITLANGADMTLQNIRLYGQKTRYNGRAIHITEESSLTILNNTGIEYFKQEAAAGSAGADVKGGAILMDDGTSLTINGGYNRTATFSYNEVNNKRTDGNTGSDGGAIAVGANCTFNITNAQFTRNNAIADAEKKGNGGAISINRTKNADEQARLPMHNVVFSNNTSSYKGGAIRTAENCNLTVSNCTFNNNHANINKNSGGEGGAIAVLSKKDAPSTLTIINGTTFTNNRAESGGAVKIGGYGTLTLENVTMQNNRAYYGNGGAVSIAPGAQAALISGTISDNRADKYGGAFYVEGTPETTTVNSETGEEETTPETRGVLTISGGTISGNSASYGGAIYAANYADIIISGGNITSNAANNHAGGAVYANEYATVTISGGTITGNTAGTSGGAIYANQYATIAISESSITGNTARNNNGGAICTNEHATVTVSGGTITGNKASLGGAVYAANYAEVTITDASITGNTATAANGGAINVAGRYARLYFGGIPTVFDNFGAQGKNQQMNLVLNVNYNDVINTTTDGLVDGVIGVFVIESNKTIFENHGLPGKPFGTFGDSGHANPQVFRSDHALSLYGVTVNEVKENVGDDLIYWVDVICKLTDANDKILYQDINLTINGKKETRKAQAVYARITDYEGPNDISNGFNALINGFNAAQGTLYVRDETQEIHTFSDYPKDTDTTVKLKMLKDYDLDKSIQYQDERMVTFTTAETGSPTDTMRTQGDYFCFKTARTDADGKALITRAFANDSMIEDKGTRLTLTDITLDGAKNSYTANVNGGIVNVASGSALTVTGGAALQNSATTANGGAVYVSTGAGATFSGGTVNGNTAANGAGFYLAWDSANNHAVLNLSGNPSFGGTDRKGGDGTDKDDLKGTEGNFVRKDTSFKTETDKEPTNGSKPYPKDNAGYYLVRQDIYIHDTATPHNAIHVTGEITSGDGTIWVWANGKTDTVNHYEMLKQFAVFADGTREAIETADTNNGTDMLNKTYHAFRNAQPDSLTNCGGDYLTGQKGDDINGWKCIYWTGGFDVVFLKTDAYGGWKLDTNGNKISEGLPGAVFTLYTDDACTTPYEMTFTSGDGVTTKNASSTSSDGTATYKDKNGSNVTLEKGEVLLSKVPPKIFYLKETTPPSGYNRDENKTTVYQVEVSSTGALTMRKKDANGDYTVEVFKEKRREVTVNGVQTDLIQYVVTNIPEAERKAILRKVNNTYASLQGAQFQIFRYDGMQVTSNNESTFISGANGVYFIDKLSYGVYYLYEKTAPTGYTSGKWFTLKVGDDSEAAPGSRDGVTVAEITDPARITELRNFVKP